MLCCKVCKWDGKHKGHNVTTAEESGDFVKGILEASIGTIERELKSFQDIQERVPDGIDRIQSKKEQAKEFVKQHFDEIRRALDEKEIEMLKSIDGAVLGDEELEDLFVGAQNALDDLSSALVTGKFLLNEISSPEFLAGNAYKAISIENKAKEISRIKNACADALSFAISMESGPFEDDAKRVAQLVSSLSSISIKRVSTASPKSLSAKSVGPFFATLEWDRGEEQEQGDFKYVVSIQKGEEATCVECNANRCSITTLEPETVYVFKVRAKRGPTTMGEWSDSLTVKTTTSSTVESVLEILKGQWYDAEVYARALEEMMVLARDSKKRVVPRSFFIPQNSLSLSFNRRQQGESRRIRSHLRDSKLDKDAR